ncbi:MAG: phenylalanine--tRNA ligase subunit beta [Methyloligella sp. ZOD6]
MKFTLSWLKEHLDTDASLEEIAEKLTVIGLEVEEIVDPAEAFKAYTVAEVVAAEKHPDADKLQVCTVNTGSETLQVVCGAPNARAGMKGVFAPVGTYVAGIDLTLTKAKIRGVESFGMLCSERELELSDEHHGIIELPADTEVGSPAADALGLTDAMIDIAITPNRPDCLAVSGIARDLAAAGLGTFKEKPVEPVKGSFANPQPIALKFDADTADACPVFAGRVVKGVKNGPSPDWLQAKLKAIGLRPINALVDITNYISFDRARPLHVYDADKLEGTICARLGKAGERFEALDGKTYEADTDATVIADDEKVLGFGGIMGGEETGCTEETTNVFIESAYFDPIRTAKTGRRFNIVSDARYRFERGVDPQFVVPGLELATQIILDLCGGEASEIEVAGEAPKGRPGFGFDPARVKRLSGLDISNKEIEVTLEKLGFELSGSAPNLEVTPPSWRPDIHGPADLVEEIVRLVGVDKVAATPMPRASGVAKPVLTQSQIRQRLARRVLAARGLVEAVTWSFIPEPHAKLFGGGAPALKLDNPISSEMSDMRPSLLPGLVTAAQRNKDRGFSDGGLFELGQAYSGAKPEDQYLAASGVRFGNVSLEGLGRDWQGDAPKADVFSAKADLAALLQSFGLDPSNMMVVAEVPDWFHPGRSGSFKLGPKVTLATFGELHPETLRALGAEGPMAGFELYLDALPKQKKKGSGRSALGASDLQAVRRDFAFLVDEAVPAGDLLKAARSADKALIAQVGLFDVFTGQGVPEGKKSLAIEVTLQPKEKTLTDKEIDAVAEKIVASVAKATGGELRG